MAAIMPGVVFCRPVPILYRPILEWTYKYAPSVAMLPVSDEGHILSHEWGDQVMQKINANVVFPMHYHVNGVNIPGWAGSESAIKWVTKHKHTMLDGPTVVLTKDKVKGISVPVASLMKNPANQTVVWVKTAPERFEPRTVSTEPLDGVNAAVTSGLEPGDRVATQSATLINQVR